MTLRILLAMVLCGSGAFGLAFFNKRFEELITAYYLSIVIVLFVFGLFNALLVGWWLVFAAIVTAYIVCAIKVLRVAGKDGMEVAASLLTSTFFTPGFVFFIILLFVLMACNGGVMSTEWDEFTHWGLIVKQMTEYNALSFNTVFEGTLFRSYPPGVALFQYFGQRIAVLSGNEFKEWLSYLFLQVLEYSFFAPLLNGLELKKGSSWVCLLIMFLCPLAVFDNALSNLGVDCLLGVASAAGLAYLHIETEDDKAGLRNITVLLDVAFLTLVKDAGMLFAVILAVAYISKNKKWLPPFLCVAIPRLLWRLLLAINNVPESFGDNIDVNALLNIIAGRDSSYKAGVWKNFWQVLFCTEGMQILNIGIPLLVVLVLVLTLIRFLGDSKRLMWLCTIQTILFFFGLALVYVFKFSEYEADKLASFQRYIGIIVNELWTLLIFLLICWIKERCKIEKNCVIPALILCLTLSVCSIGNVKDFLFKNNLYYSEQARSGYDSFFSAVDNQMEEESSIYFVSPDSSGYDYFLAIYDLYKHPFNSYDESWSVVTNIKDGNQWSREVDAEQWQQELKDNYDYVLLFDVQKSFADSFSGIFEDGDSIASRSLYKVSKETGRLQICPIGN